MAVKVGTGSFRPLFLSTFLISGCYGGLHTTDARLEAEDAPSGSSGGWTEAGDGTEQQGGSGTERQAGGDIPDEGGSADDGVGDEDGVGDDGLSLVGAAPGVRLLTQREYTNAVAEVLGVQVDYHRVPEEQVFKGHTNLANAQGVGLQELEAYFGLGLEVGEQFADGLVLDCDLAVDSCAESLALELLTQLFRQPLTSEIQEEYLMVLGHPDAGDDPPERLATVIALALTSPHFLYRTELGSEEVPGQPGVRWLTDYEIASRLSFLLWQSGPDEPLLEAALSGSLRDPDERERQLQRMLADTRARRGQLGFVYDWMAVHEGTMDEKIPAVLEGTHENVIADSEASLDRTIELALFEDEGSFASLISTDHFAVNEAVADLLNVPVETDDFSFVAMRADERRGILMHPTVLAAHTAEQGKSPFPIGKWFYENMLCATIPPPIEIPDAEEQDTADLTFREQMEELTAPIECQACHSRISPPGFAFLPFDPIGRFEDADPAGRPWDTTGEIPIGTETISFANAPDLVDQVAKHPRTAECVAVRLFRWTYGRFETEADDVVLDGLSQVAVDTSTDVASMLVYLVRDDSFAQIAYGEE